MFTDLHEGILEEFAERQAYYSGGDAEVEARLAHLLARTQEAVAAWQALHPAKMRGYGAKYATSDHGRAKDRAKKAALWADPLWAAQERAKRRARAAAKKAGK